MRLKIEHGVWRDGDPRWHPGEWFQWISEDQVRIGMGRNSEGIAGRVHGVCALFLMEEIPKCLGADGNVTVREEDDNSRKDDERKQSKDFKQN